MLDQEMAYKFHIVKILKPEYGVWITQKIIKFTSTKI